MNSDHLVPKRVTDLNNFNRDACKKQRNSIASFTREAKNESNFKNEFNQATKTILETLRNKT